MFFDFFIFYIFSSWEQTHPWHFCRVFLDILQFPLLLIALPFLTSELFKLRLSVHFQRQRQLYLVFHTDQIPFKPPGFSAGADPCSRWTVWMVSHLWGLWPLPPTPLAPCVVPNYSWIPFNKRQAGRQASKQAPPPSLTLLPPFSPPHKKKKNISECSWSLPTCFARSKSATAVGEYKQTL